MVFKVSVSHFGETSNNKLDFESIQVENPTPFF